MNDAARVALGTADELTLVTRGRRTGTSHVVRLWFGFDGTDVWLRTDATTDWYRNLLHDPRCRLRVGGTELDGTRVSSEGDADALRRRLVELWRAKYGPDWVADWYVERGRIAVRIRVG